MNGTKKRDMSGPMSRFFLVEIDLIYVRSRHTIRMYDLQSNHKQKFLDWSQQVLFTADSNSGCNKSSTKQYFQVNNKKLGGIHCVSVKILNNKDYISGNYHINWLEQFLSIQN